jgi:primosomal protein N'
MLIQIIPARRMPLFLTYLDYLAPKKLASDIKIGQLVKIPFRGKDHFGIVNAINLINNLSKQEKTKLKEIKEIIFKKPTLSKEQINFLQSIADFYHVSLGFLIKTNLLPLQKRKLSKTILEQIKFKIKIRKASKPVFYTYVSNLEKKEYFSNHLKPGSQSLILVPEQIAIKEIANLLEKEIKEKIAIITSELSNKEMFEKWLEIYSGKKNIVIGTRRALFLPWSNLTDIFLDDEANPNYKSWEMAPRIHTRDACLSLAKHHSSQLHLLTHTPSVESYFFAKKNIYYSSNEIFKQKKFNPEQINNQIKIVDMRQERRSGNYTFISEKLNEEIKKTSDENIFIFLNRRGFANYVGCRDCGNIIKCVNCNRTMTFYQDNNTLRCHYCKISSPMRVVCQKCQGINMTMYGAGTQSVENSIKKLVGDKKQVIRIDSDSVTKIFATPSSYSTIIIGTQQAWPYVDWKKTELVIFLDADTSLFIPEYKVSENLWQLLRDAQYKMRDDAKLIIQTNHPEHLIFTSLSEPKKFYEQELKERRLLGYPPYRYLLKLTYGHANQKIAENEASNLYNTLLGLTKNKIGIKLSNPLETTPYLFGGQYRLVILAKIKYDNYRSDIKLLLSKLPSGWKVDPNPNEILQL